MKKMFLLLIVFFLHQISFSQDTALTSLKTALQKAQDDTTRLRLYLDLADLARGKDKLLYTETAVKLGEEILKRTSDKKNRRPVLVQQIRAYNKLDTLLFESGKGTQEPAFTSTELLLKLNTELGDHKGMAEQQRNMAYLKLYRNADTAGFLSYLQMSLQNFRQAGDTTDIIGFYQQLGNYYFSIGNFPKGLEALQTALATARDMHDKKGYANCSLLLADTYRNYGEGAQALQYYQTALPIFQELKDTAGLWTALAALGGFYYKQNNTAKAIETYQQVIALLEAKKELRDKTPSVYNWMGQVYKDAKDFTKSLHYYETSLEGFKNQKDTATSLNVPAIRIHIAMVLGGLGDVYQEKGEFAKAADYHLQESKIYSGLKSEPDLASSYLGVARAYLHQRNYPLAKQYGHQALQLEKKQVALEPISQAELLASQIDSASGNGIEALLHYKEYVRLNNQLRGDEVRKAAQKEKYEAEFTQQKALNTAEQEKKEAVAKAQLKAEQTKRYALYGGLFLLAVFALFLFNRFRVTKNQKQVIEKQKGIVEREKRRSDDLLLNILPAEVAEELKEKGQAEAKQFDQVTVMFTDFKDFTQTAEKLSPKELVAEIDSCFKAFDNIVSKHNVEKIKTIGDSYMCVGGLPVANKTHAIDVVRAALEIQQYMSQQLEEQYKEGKETFEIRIGIHTGPVVAGIVGIKKFAYDVWGDTVNIASRMESSGEAGRVNISGETHEIVKEVFTCSYRGKIKAKNKGEIDMYFVESVSMKDADRPAIDGLEKVELTDRG